MRKQSGFAAIELVLVLVIVAAIGGIGYYASHNHSQPIVATSTSQPAPVSTPVAPQITTASDLNTAMLALNQTRVGASNTDSSQLNSQVSGF